MLHICIGTSLRHSQWKIELLTFYVHKCSIFHCITSCFLSGGSIVPPHISSAVISEVGVSGSECVVTVSWSEPVISCNGSTSQYVLTVSPPTTEWPSGSCEVGRGEERFEKRELNVTLTVEQMYNCTVRADTCNNTQTGQDSEQLTIQMEGNEVVAWLVPFWYIRIAKWKS